MFDIYGITKIVDIENIIKFLSKRIVNQLWTKCNGQNPICNPLKPNLSLNALNQIFFLHWDNKICVPKTQWTFNKIVGIQHEYLPPLENFCFFPSKAQTVLYFGFQTCKLEHIGMKRWKGGIDWNWVLKTRDPWGTSLTWKTVPINICSKLWLNQFVNYER